MFFVVQSILCAEMLHIKLNTFSNALRWFQVCLFFYPYLSFPSALFPLWTALRSSGYNLSLWRRTTFLSVVVDSIYVKRHDWTLPIFCSQAVVISLVLLWQSPQTIWHSSDRDRKAWMLTNCPLSTASSNKVMQQLHSSTLVKFHVSCTILEEECSNTKCRTVIQKSAEQCSILTIEICHNLWFEVCLWKTSISIHCLTYQHLSHLCTDSNIGGRSCYVIWWPAQQEQYPIQNDSWYFYGKPFTHTHTQMGQPSGDLAQGHFKPSAIWLVDDLF